MMNLLFRRLGMAVALWAAALGAWAAPQAEHVLIISIDGGKPAVIAQSEMPMLKRLAAEGAATWNAQTIFPSLTLPSHTSMLTGVGPAKHHVLWNAWEPKKGVVGVPTIFKEVKAAGFSTAMFVGKEKFRHFLQPDTVDHFDFNPAPSGGDVPTASRTRPKPSGTVSARKVAQAAAQYIREERPTLCFIHFTDADDTGHKYGWGSRQQMQALREVDLALADVWRAIQAAGISEQSVLIITADHGGHRKTHGRNRPEDMTIPWIVWGKSVKPGFQVTNAVTTYDTAATALWLLAVPVPNTFDGKPLFSAFVEQSSPIAAKAPPGGSGGGL